MAESDERALREAVIKIRDEVEQREKAIMQGLRLEEGEIF